MKLIEWINLGLLIAAVAGGSVYVGNLNGRVDTLQPERIEEAVRKAVERIGKLAQPPSLVPQEFKWEQGKPEVEMIGMNEGFCSLVYVTGRFEGGGEAVSIDVKGNSWYLGGKSNQAGVAARARCWKWSQ